MKWKSVQLWVIAAVIGLAGVAQAGEYDGIWMIPDYPMYFMVYNTDSTLVVTEIDSTFLTCDVLVGQMSGNVGTVQHLVHNDNSDIQANIAFDSPTTATFVVTGCSGNCTNAPPIGAALSFQKIL